MIYHSGFTKFYKINHIHSRQLEQKINENICQNSAGYISNCAPAPITVTSFYMFYITSSSLFPFDLSARSEKMGNTHIAQYTVYTTS